MIKFPSELNGTAAKEAQARMAAQEQQMVDFCTHFPALANHLFFNTSSFRGFTIVIGKRGGYLAISKRYDRSGQPQIMFSNGDSPWEAFLAAEKGVLGGYWRDDVEAPDYVPPVKETPRDAG